MIDVTRFVNSRFTSNTYVISNTESEGIWVVDPGDFSPVQEYMSANSKTTILGVLLTHAHFDHIYGVNDVYDHYPTTPIYVYNEEGRTILYDVKKNGSKYTEQPIIINNEAQVNTIIPELRLWPDVILRSYYTPGHSEDSMCMLLGNILFTGDTLIHNIRTVTKLKGGSVEKLQFSINWISTLKGHNIQIYGGHESPFDLDSYDLTIATLNKLDK